MTTASYNPVRVSPYDQPNTYDGAGLQGPICSSHDSRRRASQPSRSRVLRRDKSVKPWQETVGLVNRADHAEDTGYGEGR